jgi:phospholipase A1/A2
MMELKPNALMGMTQVASRGLGLPSLSLLGLSLFGTSLSAQAATLSLSEAFENCRKSYPTTFEAKKRLACFDSIEVKTVNVKPTDTVTQVEAKVNDALMGNTALNDANPAVKSATADELASSPTVNATLLPAQPQRDETARTKQVLVVEPVAQPSFLDRKWRLTSKGDWNISDIETYKMNYLLVTHNSNTNNMPSSPNFTTTADRGLDNQDVKFQFSLKTELMKSIPVVRKLPYVESSRIWAAYTQQSFWQFFDGGNSRPFRENNYEPELILSLGLDDKNDGIIKPYLPKMLNLGIVHQSNGREDPLSRSWNRIYLQGGWELNDKFTLLVRPAWRIPESNRKDDNPDITKFMGYGDMSLRWDDPNRKMAASVLMRNNLRADNKGFIQLDFQRQITQDRNINFHILASSGYGASLLDYNVYQNTIGFGISLGE